MTRLVERGIRYLEAFWRMRRLRTIARPRWSREEVTEAAFTFAHRFIQPMQVRSEITACLERVETLGPRCVVEIGTAAGGTLLLWSRVAAPDAVIISIDLPGGPFGGGYSVWRKPVYKRLVRPSQTLHLLRMDSHREDTLRKVKELLDGRPCDFLFIDADHTYEGVRQDFRTYSALVRPGGVIALHDIVPDTRHPACGVDRFWSEVKGDAAYRWEEYVEDWSQSWAGIGILEAPARAAIPDTRGREGLN
ncbi:MAG TPA: class I SAM-dependent methyltransferase [Bryobacterales bacterium]|nr:class I SAM-dependent methyltransferase [Bryobacterales bacterium]